MKKIIFLSILAFTFLVSFSQVKRTTTKKTTKPLAKTAAKSTTKTVTKSTTTAKTVTNTSSNNTSNTNTGGTSNSNTNTSSNNTTNTSNSYVADKQKTTASKKRSAASSDESSFSKGDNVLDLGIGFSGYGTPFHGGFEHLFTDDISAGVFLNFASYRSVSVVWGGVKGNYHFNRILNLDNNKADIFAGASIGYWSVGGVSSSFGNTVLFGVQIGGRYFFSDKIGAFAEFGGGNLSGGTVGVSFKF
jgi:hypothetical protein